jgi:transposase, IS6 family
VDETYVKVKGVWMYLYRAVDFHGKTIECFLSATHYAQVAKQFFSKALVILELPRHSIDKNAKYPKAHNELRAERTIPEACELRQ